jgi:serine/threonine-protein kinase
MERVREGEILQGKYRVERVIGVGGMGVVVAAQHLELGTRVAIKSLRPQGRGQRELLLRFEREARAAVRIKSEHVARVLDVARLDDGTPYLVMEYLDGNDLSDWLRLRGPLTVEQAVELVIQACEAIAEAHTLGIVHRDLKPANLFVTRGRDGQLRVKVLDFGISKSEPLSGEPAMTRTHSMLGSPEYMSPEQFDAPKTVDWRTDIWSIGATLFELLTGRTPFEGDEVLQIAFKIMHEPAPLLSALRAAPPGLTQVIQRCLEKDRSARFHDVAELVTALAPFALGRSRASVERITRMAEATRVSLAATQPAFTWPPPQPTERPLVASIPVPAFQRQSRQSWVITLLASMMGVFVMLAMCAVGVSHQAPAPAQPSFDGMHGVTRATWVLGGTYDGIVHTNGPTGYVDVHTIAPDGRPVDIREDLALQRGPDGWSYVGSNPRHADTGRPATGFIPNVFHLQPVADGTWTLAETCARDTTTCAPMQPAS